MRSKFISVEGIEGSGKSTLIPKIVDCVTRITTQPVCTTREPGGTPCAEAIRSIFLSDFEESVHPKTELLLVYAARMQHIQEVISPNLAAGNVIVCDRYFDASHAYQGGVGIDSSVFEFMNHFVVDTLVPDLTLLLDVPVQTAFARIKSRDPDRMEQKSVATFEKIRAAYLTQAEQAPARFKIIDARQPLAGVIQTVETELHHFFECTV